ncbi:Lrp/AsnC family transcriptional regulator [Arthrobacter woluwensis]|uniref:Lrp/AsnC family transcriptional regulator n=1 Tax=Arthrobacter woluwensis TaxID=156980 RepID=UPI0037F1AC3B
MAENLAMFSNEALDELDQKIIAALQVNSRAEWRRIAHVIDAPERTVAARGADLLKRRLVRLTTLTLLPEGGITESLLITLRCVSGMSRVAGNAVAARGNVIFSFLTTGDIDGVFEVMTDRRRAARVLFEEIPGTPGVTSSESSTVLRLYKASHQWLPGILAEDQVAQLSDPERSWEPTGSVELPPLGREDLTLTRVLLSNARATVEELARAAGVSPSSAKRRLVALQSSGRIFDRAVVEPARLGFPVEAVLRIRTRPGRVEVLAEKLAAEPRVRYLALVASRYQLFVNVAFPDHESLTEFLVDQEIMSDAVEVNTSMVVVALKRSGIPVVPGMEELS